VERAALVALLASCRLQLLWLLVLPALQLCPTLPVLADME
jgi:hypothetical protein